MVVNNFDKLAEDLERQELEVRNVSNLKYMYNFIAFI